MKRIKRRYFLVGHRDACAANCVWQAALGHHHHVHFLESQLFHPFQEYEPSSRMFCLPQMPALPHDTSATWAAWAIFGFLACRGKNEE
jgi:hypothetical protein